MQRADSVAVGKLSFNFTTFDKSGVLMAHGNVLVAAMTVIPGFGANDIYLAYVPLAHIFELAAEADILENFAIDLEDLLKKTGGYPRRSEKEPPSSLLWTLFYFAQIPLSFCSDEHVTIGVCPIYKHTELDDTGGVNEIKVITEGIWEY
ncbi:hypothetical protein E3N88_29490 [Mikania micrantha]|uniref:4-coumarate--CoA ligase n=1 Tax=Mikania micrantha TaxID=192012 RepID=A0A5N6ML27_9ASTR|nr:hypothetical protein E3N88_29490 [Mikania micrantha]